MPQQPPRIVEIIEHDTNDISQVWTNISIQLPVFHPAQTAHHGNAEPRLSLG